MASNRVQKRNAPVEPDFIPVTPQGAKPEWSYREDTLTGDLWAKPPKEKNFRLECWAGKWYRAEMSRPGRPSDLDWSLDLMAPTRTCRRCGNAIVGSSAITTEQIAERTLNSYGETLCATCGIFARNGIILEDANNG
jgi:hypothetical protein